MKKLTLLIILLVMAVTVSLFTPAVTYAAAERDLVSQANQLREDAVQSKSSKVRDEKYKQAVRLYERSMKKQETEPVEAAKARLELARLYATAKGDSSNKPMALELYQQTIRDYDKPLSELKRVYTPQESEELKVIAGQAVAERRALVSQIDRENSGKWQYKIMDWFVNLTGARPGFSYWFALVLITVIVKIIITPLTKAQFKSMKEMQKIQPLMKELQEKYKGDQKVLQEKMMALYKEHGVNPFASCLPLLVQMPILILLFNMISVYQYQFEKGTFLWIGSGLSHLTHVFVPIVNKVVWFTAANLSEPDLILVVLYLISMFISQRISIVDPTQAEQQKMMSILFPIMFGFIFAGFPSAFLLYWLVFNILQTAQQYFIIKSGQHETPATAVGPSVDKAPAPDAENESERVTRRPSGRRSGRRRRR